MSTSRGWPSAMIFYGCADRHLNHHPWALKTDTRDQLELTGVRKPTGTTIFSRHSRHAQLKPGVSLLIDFLQCGQRQLYWSGGGVYGFGCPEFKKLLRSVLNNLLCFCFTCCKRRFGQCGRARLLLHAL